MTSSPSCRMPSKIIFSEDNPVRFLDVYVSPLDLKDLGFLRVEPEANRNLEVIWLLKRLAPDLKTIADFRKANDKAICNLCRDFIQFCKREDLYGGEPA